MSDFDVAQFNLNLLPALDALLAERSVSGAARRLGISQSAMSHSLARLRDELDDPLLVLAGRRMQPTPRAMALAAPLREALVALGRSLAPPRSFEPATARRRFTIATYDLFELIMLPELLRYLGTEAPSITLRIERLAERSLPRVQRGEIDLVLCSASLELPRSGVMRQLIAEEPYAVVARRDHPRLRRKLDVARYVAEEHVLVSLEGRAQGVVDRALGREGQRRHVALTVPHFLSALALVAGSDSVATVPASAAARGKELFGLRLFAPPIELPAVKAVMVWPRQLDDDAGHRWLREVLRGDAESASAIVEYGPSRP